MKKQTLVLSCFLAVSLLSSCGGRGGLTSSITTSSPTTGGTSATSSSSSTSTSSTSSSSSSSTIPGPVIHSFTEFVSALRLSHNYTLSVRTHLEFDESSEDDYTNTFRNISDQAYYWDYYSWSTGYIYQKDQGFVNFYLVGSSISPDGFVSTNPYVGISDFVDVVAENLFTASYVQQSEDPTKYDCSDTDVIAVACNFSGYADSSWMTAPSSITATYTGGETMEISCNFQIYYYDEETYEPVIENGYTTITISDVGSTSNAAIESYVINPTTVFTAPTAWSATDLGYFNSYFNSYVPPFISGVSYSFETYTKESYDGMKICATDYSYTGDPLSSYGTLLVNDGFSKISNSLYKKIVKDEILGKTTTYTVEMGTVKGDIQYPNGIFQAIFSSKTVNNTVDSLKALNEYITKNGLQTAVPLFSIGEEEIPVTGFVDKTQTMIQLYGDNYLFWTGSSTGTYSKIVLADFTKAKALFDSYVVSLDEYGYDDISRLPSLHLMTLTNSSESPYQSQVAIYDLDTYTKDTYPGYIEFYYHIYKNPAPASKSLEAISVSDMTTDYSVGDEFEFDGICTAYYTDSTNEVVEPTSVSSPDMSVAGSKTIVVSYTEDEVTKTTSYVINVSSPTSAPTLEFTPNEHISSYQFLNGNNQEITKFDVDESSGYFFMRFTCEDGYLVSSLSIPNDSDATISYDDQNLRWELKPTITTGESIVVEATTSQEGYKVSKGTFDHGKVILSVPSTESYVEEGSTVRFSIKPDENYTVDKVYILEDETYSISKHYLGDYSYYFTMPAFDVTIMATLKSTSPEPVTLSSIKLSGMTTSYNVDDEFEFDGVCTAVYSDKSETDVTPTSVSTPDMTTAGKKTITVSYTEGDVTKTADYEINVIDPSKEDDLTGTYVCEILVYDITVTLTMNFDDKQVTYEYNGSELVASYVAQGGELSLTYVSGEIDDFSSYRLFVDKQTPNTSGTYTSSSISIELYNMFGKGTSRTFSKVEK